MNAAVVYESLWGNTAAIAGAIADGIGESAVALSTSQADAAALAGVGLIVAGAPILGFSLPTEQMRENIAKTPGPGPAPDLSSPAGAVGYATFETRIWWSPGSAAKTIAKALASKGYREAAPAEKFLVTGRYGPLKDGELERARAWGAAIGKSARG
jgi:flavodoxin